MNEAQLPPNEPIVHAAQIAQYFTDYGVNISEEQAEQFSRYLTLFLAYNQHTNLSAIRVAKEVVLKHFIDSAVLLPYIDNGSKKLLDIGSGGGFPGIPLKLLRPELQLTLLDSVRKKTLALQHFCSELQLSDTTVVWQRAEAYADEPGVAAGYDVVTARAVAYLPQLLEWCHPFLKPNGQIMLLKQPSEAELSDGLLVARELGLKMERVTYTLADAERSILRFYFAN